MQKKRKYECGLKTAYRWGYIHHIFRVNSPMLEGVTFLIGRGWLYCAIITGNLYFHVAIIIFSKESKFVS